MKANFILSSLNFVYGWIKKCTNTSPTHVGTQWCFCPNNPIPVGTKLSTLRIVTTPSMAMYIEIALMKFSDTPEIGSVAEQIGSTQYALNDPAGGIIDLDASSWEWNVDSPYTYIAIKNCGFTPNKDNVKFAVLNSTGDHYGPFTYYTDNPSYKALSLGYK